jgi:IS30 family transposase
MKYRQLAQTQRYQISALRLAGKSQRQIAAMLGCHNSTISRELRRNSIRGYEPERAQHQANTRRRTAFKRHKRVQWLTDWVTKGLKEHWSPEQIAAPKRLSIVSRLATGKTTQYSRATNNPAW